MGPSSLRSESEVLQESHYYPFGMTMDGNWVTQVGEKNRYLYNGKELEEDFGLDLSDYGARWYDASIGRWGQVDPLADKYSSYSGYNYTLNNPIKFIDPDGKAPDDVIIRFNKYDGSLRLIDLDHYKAGLPTVTVSASEYKLSGIRDSEGKLTHNQILLIEGVQSGGHVDLNDSFVSNGNPREKEIPSYTYNILDDKPNSRRPDFYRLDAQDGIPNNDQYDVAGEVNSEGRKRTGFRLHPGKVSWGCVTICKTSDDNRSTEWNIIEQILQNTSTTTVKDNRGKQGWNPFSWRTKYGEMDVVGDTPDDSSIKID